MDYNDYKEKERKSRENAIENITGISKSYFEALCEACSKIGDFKNKLLGNFDFLGALNKSSFFIEADFRERVTHCLCTDAIRCLKEMGTTIDAESEEMLGLFLYTAYVVGDDFNMEYDTLLRIDSVIKSQISYYVLLEDFAKQFSVTSNLLISSLLPDGSELFQQYHILLYRWASLVAKADGVITDQEQAWLQKLMTPSPVPAKPIQTNNEEPINEVDAAREDEESPLDVLHNMIGLSSVKQEVETLYNFVNMQQQRKKMGLKTSSVSYHCVFTGNAGTGKTTIARVVAQIYKELGILKKGHLVETDRSGLVAEYVGQTAIKTNQIIDSALDGVLFIDEAYALSEGGDQDFGKEAISTLIKRMEDDRDRLVVILAGYSENMKRFMDANLGLQSRFNKYIHFPNYSEEELYEIFLANLKRYEYTMTPEADSKLKEIIRIELEKNDPKFGNGRFVRNLFERTIEHQANRLAAVPSITPEILSTITESDF